MRAKKLTPPDPLMVDDAGEYFEDIETNLNRAAHALRDAHPDYYPPTPEGFQKALKDVSAAALRNTLTGARAVGMA